MCAWSNYAALEGVYEVRKRRRNMSRFFKWRSHGFCCQCQMTLCRDGRRKEDGHSCGVAGVRSRSWRPRVAASSSCVPTGHMEALTNGHGDSNRWRLLRPGRLQAADCRREGSRLVIDLLNRV